MKTIRVVGIALVIIGCVGFAFQGITYTSRENTIDIGSLHVTTEKDRWVPPIPALCAALALIGGIVLLVIDRKQV